MSAKPNQKKQSRGPLVALILILAAVGWTVFRFGRSEQTGAFYAAQIDALNQLRGAQAAYLATDADGDGRPDSVYAGDLSLLPDVSPGPGVGLTLVHGGATGWAAVTRHERIDGGGCAFVTGEVPEGFATPAGQSVTLADRMYCDR